MNTKLMNVAVVLVIVCAVAFLALWAIPTFTQKTGENIERGVEIAAPIIEEQKEKSEANDKEEALQSALQLIADEQPSNDVRLVGDYNWNGENESSDLLVVITDANTRESVEMIYEFSYKDGRLKIDGSTPLAELYD